MSDHQEERHGSCFCGNVSLTVRGPPMAVSICHCTTCQQLLGAPFGIQSMHSASAVECATPREELWSLETSKMVTRYRCPQCASPVYATLRNGKLIVIPRSMLFQTKTIAADSDIDKNDDAFKPTHHMYYASRIMNVDDDLPKYVGTSQPGRGVLWTPDEAAEGEATPQT